MRRQLSSIIKLQQHIAAIIEALRVLCSDRGTSGPIGGGERCTVCDMLKVGLPELLGCSKPA